MPKIIVIPSKKSATTTTTSVLPQLRLEVAASTYLAIVGVAFLLFGFGGFLLALLEALINSAGSVLGKILSTPVSLGIITGVAFVTSFAVIFPGTRRFSAELRFIVPNVPVEVQAAVLALLTVVFMLADLSPLLKLYYVVTGMIYYAFRYVLEALRPAALPIAVAALVLCVVVLMFAPVLVRLTRAIRGRAIYTALVSASIFTVVMMFVASALVNAITMLYEEIRALAPAAVLAVVVTVLGLLARVPVLMLATAVTSITVTAPAILTIVTADEITKTMLVEVTAGTLIAAAINLVLITIGLWALARLREYLVEAVVEKRPELLIYVPALGILALSSLGALKQIGISIPGISIMIGILVAAVLVISGVYLARTVIGDAEAGRLCGAYAATCLVLSDIVYRIAVLGF